MSLEGLGQAYIGLARSRDREMVERAILVALMKNMIYDPKMDTYTLFARNMWNGDAVQRRVVTVMMQLRNESGVADGERALGPHEVLEKRDIRKPV